MQFIHDTPVRVVVRSEIPPIHDTKGNLIQLKSRRLFAQFRRGEAPQWAAKVAVNTFTFTGIQQGVEKERWCAFYDSVEDQERHGFTDEERGLIEQKLLRQGYLQVTRPKAAKPWPTYDKVKNPEAIAAMAQDLGLVQATLDYERDRDKPNQKIIEALESVEQEQETEEEIVA